MVLTEEMKRNFPTITDEELAAIRVPKDELIRRIIENLDKELKEEGLYD